MHERMPLDLFQEASQEAQAAESTLGQVLETAIHAGKGIPPEHPGIAVLARVLVEQSNVILPHILQLPGRVQQLWGKLCAAGWAGEAEQVHSIRGFFLSDIEGKLRLTEQACRIAEMHTLPEVAALRRAEQDLRHFRSEVFGRWHTLEDLQDILAESFPLSDKELAPLEKRYGPPAVWYAQDGKPF
jgi:hypothetical protein